MSASIKARSRPSALDSNAAGGSAGGVDASGQQSEFLEVNPAFQEMLTAIEGFDARSTSGESCSQYEIAFYGALRTMMRECLFTAEPRERNAHISKVHSWFSEKRSRSAPSAAGAAVAPTPRRANRSGLAPAQRPVTAPSRAFPQVTSDDPERQERRLRYVQRQLSSVQPPAPQSADLPSIHIASESSRSPSPSASPLASPQRTRDPWLSSSAQITSPQRRGSSIQLMPMHRREKSGRLQSHFRTRDLSASRMRREGTPIPEAPQQQLETANDIEQAEKVLRDMWVDKRRLEEVERQGQEEVRRALVSWATQRARVNEEIARKQESSRFASRSQQLYSRPNSRPTTAKSRGSGSSPTNMKVHMDFGIDEDSDHRFGRLFMPPQMLHFLKPFLQTHALPFQSNAAITVLTLRSAATLTLSTRRSKSRPAPYQTSSCTPRARPCGRAAAAVSWGHAPELLGGGARAVAAATRKICHRTNQGPAGC
jgi:hypothetical protein